MVWRLPNKTKPYFGFPPFSVHFIQWWCQDSFEESWHHHWIKWTLNGRKWKRSPIRLEKEDHFALFGTDFVTMHLFWKTVCCILIMKELVPSWTQTQVVPSWTQTQVVPSWTETQVVPSWIQTQVVPSRIQTPVVPSWIRKSFVEKIEKKSGSSTSQAWKTRASPPAGFRKK